MPEHLASMKQPNTNATHWRRGTSAITQFHIAPHWRRYLILETVCTKRKTIRIAGDDYPAELVKAKFMKLNSSHIEFVFDCMKENTTKIRNIKQYLKAVLFNAPNTIDSYYTALVNHDMYGGY